MTTGVALSRYHDATKHSLVSMRTSSHRLDWANKPLAFKVYTSLPAIPAPDDIGRLCRYSNGVLRRRRYPDGDEYGFRAAACTGALYHVELYLATAERHDLPAGLYHYSARDDCLRLLRPGDFRGALAEAGGGFPPLESAALVVALTSTFWRNAWKYQARAYRHAFWDSGSIVANLLALSSADGQPAAVVMGFADGVVNQLLGVDGVREAAVALVAIGDDRRSRPRSGPVPDLDLPTMRLSEMEHRYPDIEEAHRASSLADAGEVAMWHARVAKGDGDADILPGTDHDRSRDNAILEVIRQRRSSRNFARAPITRLQLDEVLTAAASLIPGDGFAPGLVEPVLIVNAVEGLDPGVYRSDLAHVGGGDFRRIAAALALGQPLAAAAAANIYFLSDLERVFEDYSERGYRVAQMAGGIAGGRIELAATAAGLGATGLTFFDDDVTHFLEPASVGRQVMYLAAIGMPDVVGLAP